MYWERIAKWTTIGISGLTAVVLFTVGFYRVVDIPHELRWYGYFYIPAAFAGMLGAYAKWTDDEFGPGEALLSLWLFLFGLFTPMALTWLRPQWPFGYHYRLVPLVIPVLMLSVFAIQYSWKAIRALVRASGVQEFLFPRKS